MYEISIPSFPCPFLSIQQWQYMISVSPPSTNVFSLPSQSLFAIPDSREKRSQSQVRGQSWRIPGLCLSSASSLLAPLEIFFSVDEQEIGHPSGQKDWRHAHGRRPARDPKGKLNEMLHRPTAPYTLLQSPKGHVLSGTYIAPCICASGPRVSMAEMQLKGLEPRVDDVMMRMGSSHAGANLQGLRQLAALAHASAVRHLDAVKGLH